MPPPAPALLPSTRREGAAAVYFPACINRIFGRARGAGAGLPDALMRVSERAGLALWIPPDAAGHCCGTPWSSKGYRTGHAYMANLTVEALWRWTDAGRLPVVIDASSCTLGLVDDAVPALSEANREHHAALEILDSIAWAHDRLLPRLNLQNRVGTVTVHPTCAARHLGLAHRLEALASAMAAQVHTPASATCCGFAGDRGFLHPELTRAATADEAAELDGRSFDACLCSNRTCEIGLEQSTGRGYESFVFLLEELTQLR